MNLWSLLAAPLLAGNDLSKMDTESLRILTNPEVLRIDQDTVGHQGDRIWTQWPLEIWARDLADGSKAVGLFNRNQGASSISMDLKLLVWGRAGSVRDAWLHKDLPAINHSHCFIDPPHGVVMLILRR